MVKSHSVEIRQLVYDTVIGPRGNKGRQYRKNRAARIVLK